MTHGIVGGDVLKQSLTSSVPSPIRKWNRIVSSSNNDFIRAGGIVWGRVEQPLWDLWRGLGWEPSSVEYWGFGLWLLLLDPAEEDPATEDGGIIVVVLSAAGNLDLRKSGLNYCFLKNVCFIIFAENIADITSRRLNYSKKCKRKLLFCGKFDVGQAVKCFVSPFWSTSLLLLRSSSWKARTWMKWLA